jgi:hypothetical protein
MATLVFLLTVLALLGAIATLPIMVLQRRYALARLIGGIMFVWLLLYTGLLLGFSWLTPQTFLAQGREECFDDMCFSVTAASSTTSAKGDSITVTLRLRNAARRAAEKPDHPDAYLVDREGHSYFPQAVGQQPLWNQPLQPGEIQDRALRFQVPGADQPLYLVVTEGSFPSPLIIGDDNSPVHAKTKFLLTFLP